MTQNKSRCIACRLTDEEYTLFKREVKKTYFSNSEYMRRRLLVPARQVETREERDHRNYVVLSLSQINNNINQIARVMNVLKCQDAIVIGSVAQRQINQVAEILREWKSVESKFR